MFQAGSLNDAPRNTYDLMTQNPEYGLCGCRINPHPYARTSSEIHAAGEREVRIFKGFRRRLSFLAERARDAGEARNTMAIETTNRNAAIPYAR